MNILTTRRNHMIAARFFALASKARRIALDSCVDWIERDIAIPVYCRIDTAAATYHANQARVMKARAIQSRYMRTM